jgi:hypothetical protein
MQIGIGNAAYPLNAPYLGANLDGVGTGNGGNVILNSASIGSAWGWNGGDRLGIAVDFTAKLFWIKNITFAQPWNNNVSADPATGVGGFSFSAINAGPYFVMAFMSGAVGMVWTANFGPTYTIPGGKPVGYGDW